MPLFATAIFTPDQTTAAPCPVFLTAVPAGFPSPADDFLEGALDLNQHLIRHPAATFFVHVSGDSTREAGIHSGELLIVDRALEPAIVPVYSKQPKYLTLARLVPTLDRSPFSPADAP